MVISGVGGRGEIFRVVGKGYNRNVERGRGRGGTREEGMRERGSTYVLADLYNCRRSVGEEKEDERRGSIICMRESVIDRARIQAGR